MIPTETLQIYVKAAIVIGSCLIIAGYLGICNKPNAKKEMVELLILLFMSYILAIVIVLIAATLGPFIFNQFSLYTVETPYKLSASDATSYMLQALLVIVIGMALSKHKD